MTRARAPLLALTLVATVVLASGWRARADSGQRSRAAAVLLAAGDIASCKSDGDERTARILARRRGTIATLGDNVYESGTTREFAECFAPTWGRFKRRIKPAAGNHDWGVPGAAGYFRYFGAAAGRPGRSWYSYTRGAWHIIVLDSDCDHVGGCGRGSGQERWLRRELRAHRRTCTLAYWHHPRFSSGAHGDDSEVGRFWQLLYDARADIVLAGHDHHYERFAPQTPAGKVDLRRGIRQFIVGTGGRSLYPPGSGDPASRVRGLSFGVLELRLLPGGYRWRFLPVAGSRFRDSGSGRCH